MRGWTHGKFTEANPIFPTAIKPQQQRHHRTTRQNQFYQRVRCERLKSRNDGRCIAAPIAQRAPPNLLIAYCEDVQVELRQHRNLQSQHCGASSRDGENPLRDARNQMCAVHVCIPID